VTRLLSLSEQQPALFKRMFRLDREDFFEQLRLITPEITRDSTNVGSTWIDPMIKLAITLRFLAGAIYLDLSWGYDIPHKTVHAYINETLVALDKANNNIKFPIDDEAELEKLEAGFADICGGIFRGTVAAGDGIVFRTDAPSPDEVGGDVTSFYCRKGFYAFGMQGFCDSKLKFLSIAMKVCTSSHDSTAYIVTELAHAIKTGQLPRRFHIVLDEAYRCTPQELCPWSGRKLDMYKDAFNYYLSLHRQVIERAFGVLVARWGIFWRPLRVKQRTIPLIIRVACKLHNICVDRFGTNDQIVPYIGENVRDTDVQPGDGMQILYTDGTGRPRGRGYRCDLEDCPTRELITQQLKDSGYRRPGRRMKFSRVERI
jgi:hypothetical protein